MADPVLVVDLDGTIAKYENGFQGDTIIEEPIIKVVNVLHRLYDEGWIIRIHSCRCNLQFQPKDNPELPYRVIMDYMKDNGIKWTNIVHQIEGKPYADVYLDDRSAGYNPNWTEEEMYNEIIETYRRVSR